MIRFTRRQEGTTRHYFKPFFQKKEKKMKNFTRSLMALAMIVGWLSAIPAAGDSISLRHKWRSGDRFLYSFSMQDRISVDGRWLMTIEMKNDFTNTVESVAEDGADIHTNYDDFHLITTYSSLLTGRGVQVLDVKVSEGEIEATLAGKSLPRSVFNQLARDLEPLQEIVKNGEDVRVSAQGDFPIGHLMEGDSWEVKRSMAEFSSPGNQFTGDAELTYLYTFEGIVEDTLAQIGGKAEGEVSIPVEDGGRTYQMPMTYEFMYNAMFNHVGGYLVEETVEGQAFATTPDAVVIAQDLKVEVLLKEYHPSQNQEEYYSIEDPTLVQATSWGNIKSLAAGR